MTLEEAKKILNNYSGNLAASKLPKEIMDAKYVAYSEEISKQYPEEDYPHLAPDFFEGWR